MLYITWDPSKDAFTIPFIDHPIAWYGILFALGFFVSYLIVRSGLTLRLNNRSQATDLTDKLTWYIVLGTIIGARLVEVFFYSWPYYSKHPLAIFKIWEGGLASHGGALGIFVAIYLFYLRIRKQFPTLSLLLITDIVSIGAACAGGLVRLGNFINQEILGQETTMPWGVIFGHPVDHVRMVPHHPVQLYESLFYFAVFLFLLILWSKKKFSLQEGTYVGWFFVLIFSFRFFIDWLKLPQSDVIVETTTFLSMGQYLSLPFIVVGLYLLLRRKAS